ncbi:hypothetical protein NOU13_32470 [Rhodococcus erythropolis]|uniref:hypothetical protein n=1 Tax=Rhodococcus erythropolis TaxID=1833 RepID=UPI00210A1873|nr:hypothetical protein [Rhodococcus erythropolis]MCQ4129223.1 hypothetical protein [Rhodococcus erythropolis]
MRTMVIISVGIALALVFLAAGVRSHAVGVRRAAGAFVGVWAIATIANMAWGVHEGYTATEELPILVANFLPASVVAAVGGLVLGRVDR